MRAFLDKLYRWSGGLAALFIVGICAIVFLQVMLNLVDRLSGLLLGEAIGLTIPSYADFTGFFLVAASFFALAYTLREGGHIRVTLVLQLLPMKARKTVELVCLALAAGVTLYFAVYMAALIYESYIYHDLSPGIVPVPIWIPQTSVLAGLVVLAIALLDDLVAVIRGRLPSYAGKGENLLENDDPLAAARQAENRD